MLQKVIQQQVDTERQARWEAEIADGRHPRLDASRSGPASALTLWENLVPAQAVAPPDSKELSAYLEKNEVGDAELFQRMHREEFCLDHSRDMWLTFSGVIWEDDEYRQAHRAVVELADIYDAMGKHIYRYYADKKADVDVKIYDLEREMTRLVEADANAEAKRKLKHDIETLKDDSAQLAKKGSAALKKYDQRASGL